MSKKILYCNECDVEFTVRYGMSDSHYVAKHCVFCGGEINSDEDYDMVHVQYKKTEFSSKDKSWPPKYYNNKIKYSDSLTYFNLYNIM